MSYFYSNLQDLAPVFGQQLVNGVVQGTLLAVVAWALLRLLGKPSSGMRFIAWFSVLLFIAAMPFLGGLGAASGSAAGSSSSAIHLPSTWAFYALALWDVISAVALARLGFGLWQLNRLRRNSTIVAAENLDEILAGCLAEFRKTRPVELRVSERVSVPTAIGFFHPAIILPKWALQELSTEEIHVVLLHELAHLQRRDDWTNLVQKVLRAVFFFHPAVWWIESKLSLEREMACDEMVLAHTGNPRGYAECLVSMAEKSFLHKGLALAQAAVSRMRDMTVRVSQILAGGNTKKAPSWRPALGMAGMFAMAVLVAPRAPKIVAFENSRLEQVAIAQAQFAGGSAEITREDLESPAHVFPAQFKPSSVPRVASARRPIHRSAVVTTPKAAVETEAAIVPVNASVEETKPAFQEAVFVVVQPTMNARGFSDGWDVYVIRLTVPSQNAVPAGTFNFKKT